MDENPVIADLIIFILSGIVNGVSNVYLRNVSATKACRTQAKVFSGICRFKTTSPFFRLWLCSVVIYIYGE